MQDLNVFDEHGNKLTLIDILSIIPVVCLDTVTRVEIVDSNGRAYTSWHLRNKVELSIQDDGKTLKIFISEKPIIIH